MQTEKIADLEIKLADEHPAVRGGWIRGTTSAIGLSPTPVEGEIRDILRETEGKHAGRVLLVIFEPSRGHTRFVLPENCTSRKPPAQGTLKRSRAKIHAASEKK
jgi:hypothetical protein